MFGGNRGIVLTILFVILISVASLIGVVYSLVQSLDALNFGEVNAFSPDREVEVLERGYNYNFAVPKKDFGNQETEPENVESNEEVNEETQAEEPIPVYNYNFPIPKLYGLPAMKSIQIPTIGYNSPIVISENADTGIDNGAWYYSSNHPSEGESIFLCHRRYFTSNDPKSCWDLDKVPVGASLYLNFKNGTQYSYKVISISVADGEDISIYHAGDDEVLKLISCAKEDGKIGSDSHRIILIAEKTG